MNATSPLNLNLNPAMQEVVIHHGNAYATISRVGGFMTRLCLNNRNLLHFNQDEYALAKPGNAHYGAPFVSPPGVNDGYERHGPWRKRTWSLRYAEPNLAVIADRIGDQEIVQRFELKNPHHLEVVVAAHNRRGEAAFPFECGLHYYWAVQEQSDIDIGDALNGFPAWDNLAQTEVLSNKALVHAPNLDLHVTSGQSLLTFFNRRHDSSITLASEFPSARTTYVLYATEKAPLFRAIEQWSAPQEKEKGTWKENAYQVAPWSSAIYRFAVELG